MEEEKLLNIETEYRPRDNFATLVDVVMSDQSHNERVELFIDQVLSKISWMDLSVFTELCFVRKDLRNLVVSYGKKHFTKELILLKALTDVMGYSPFKIFKILSNDFFLSGSFILHTLTNANWKFGDIDFFKIIKGPFVIEKIKDDLITAFELPLDSVFIYNDGVFMINEAMESVRSRADMKDKTVVLYSRFDSCNFSHKIISLRFILNNFTINVIYVSVEEEISPADFTMKYFDLDIIANVLTKEGYHQWTDSKEMSLNPDVKKMIRKTISKNYSIFRKLISADISGHFDITKLDYTMLKHIRGISDMTLAMMRIKKYENRGYKLSNGLIYDKKFERGFELEKNE